MAYHQLPDWDPLGACGDAQDDDERQPLASDTRAKHSGGAFATAQPYVEHTVQKGDSLRSLAVHYHTTVNSILQLNRARSEEILLMKRVIKVPNTSHASTSLFDSLKSGLSSSHSADLCCLASVRTKHKRCEREAAVRLKITAGVLPSIPPTRISAFHR